MFCFLRLWSVTVCYFKYGSPQHQYTLVRAGTLDPYLLGSMLGLGLGEKEEGRQVEGDWIGLKEKGREMFFVFLFFLFNL
jgi:hypothetical protein